MSESLKLVAFCGSLRKASFNRLSLHAFVERLPAGVTCDTIEIGDWPLYDADLQARASPTRSRPRRRPCSRPTASSSSARNTLRHLGRFEERIDWLSRMTPQPFAAKPVALFGASMGVLGTARAQYQLRQTLVFLDGRPVNKPEVMIAQAQNKFADGKLTDEMTGKLLGDLGAALALACRQAKAAASVK